MLDENRFWEIIEKNKNNPLKIWDEVHDYSLEDMFGFLVILEDIERKAFSLEKPEDYEFMADIMKEDGIYKSKCLDDVILRGKEFCDLFINKDREKIIKTLKENPKLKYGNITLNDIYNIWALRMVENGYDEYYKLKSLEHLPDNEPIESKDRQLIYDNFKKFLDVCKSKGIKDKYKNK
jgi:hypothetical protein